MDLQGNQQKEIECKKTTSSSFGPFHLNPDATQEDECLSLLKKKVNIAYTLVGMDVNYHIYDRFVKNAETLAGSTIRNRFNFMLNILDILVEVTPNSSVCNQLEASRKTFWRKIFKEWNLVALSQRNHNMYDQDSHDEDKSMDQQGGHPKRCLPIHTLNWYVLKSSRAPSS